MKRPPETRNRILNVLYFVDANKTKSFKMSLGTVYAIVATLAILLVWSFVSTLLLYRESEVAGYRHQRITHLLSTIFSYQQRYDAIYERSYPAAPKTVAGTLDKISKEAEAFGTGDPLPIAKATIAANTALAAKDKEKGEQTAPATQESAKSAPQTSASPSAAQRKSAALAQLESSANATPPAEKPFAAVLEAISATAKDQKVVNVAFSIRNNMKPERAIGYVFAKATFEVDGKEVVKTAPVGPNFAAIDKPIRARGYKFSIRSFTRKNITLSYPSGGTAKLTKLELLMWSKKKREKVYPVAMTKVRLIKELVQTKPATRQQPPSLLPTKNPFPEGQNQAGADAAKTLADPANTAKASQDNEPAQTDFPANDPFQSPELKGVADEAIKRAAPAPAATNESKPKEIAKDLSPEP